MAGLISSPFPHIHKKKPTYCPFAETDLENTTVVLVCNEDWDMTEQVNEVPSPPPQNMERLM